MNRDRFKKERGFVEGIGNALRTAFHEDHQAEIGVENLLDRLHSLPSKLGKTRGGQKDEASQSETGRGLA